jgi:hypothetical protein
MGPSHNLLTLTFIVSAGVGVFEVWLALRGKQELGLTPYQIAMMFSECSLVMFVVQAIVFSPLVKPRATGGWCRRPSPYSRPACSSCREPPRVLRAHAIGIERQRVEAKHAPVGRSPGENMNER